MFTAKGFYQLLYSIAFRTLSLTPITLTFRPPVITAQWVVNLTRNVQVKGSSPIKATRCFLERNFTLIT